MCRPVSSWDRGAGERQRLIDRTVHRLEQLGCGLTVLELGARAVHAARDHRGAQTREQRPQPVIQRERVTAIVTGHDRNADLAEQAVLRQEIEEYLEQAAVRGAV